MFLAYCVQNKTKIEAEHSGATYQMSGLEDVGLVCSFPACLPTQRCQGAPWQSSTEQWPGTRAAGGGFCRRLKYQF